MFELQRVWNFWSPIAIGYIWHVAGEIRQEVFSRRNLACGTHYDIGIFCLTEAGEQESRNSIGSLKNTEIDSGDVKNMANKSTKITIFILISLIFEWFMENRQSFQFKPRHLRFKIFVTVNILKLIVLDFYCDIDLLVFIVTLV